MKNINVIKRNGKKVSFNFDKIWEHVKYATDGLDCDPMEIISNFKIRIVDNIKTEDIQKNLIQSAEDLISKEKPDYQYSAARLLLQDLYKRVYGSFNPHFNYKVLKERIDKGYYSSDVLEKYTEEEINELSKIIDYKKDLNFTYLGLTQMVKKYSIKRNGFPIETPQEIFFLIPLYIFQNIKNKEIREWYVKKMYESLSNFEIFLPTPDMVGIRSRMKGFTSCAGINTGDSIDSIGNASKWMFHLIAEFRAGQGVNIGQIRGLDADIRDGEEIHTGIIPYVKAFEQISQSSEQPNSGRNGKITFYYPFFHWEIENILTLKNNRGSEEMRARHSDHAIVFDPLIYERANEKEKLTLFHMNDVPELFELIGTPQFKERYEYYEKTLPDKKKRYIDAEEFLRKFRNERYSTNRIYKVNAEAMQQQSAFRIPVYTSNLCLTGNTVISISYIVNGEEKKENILLKDVGKYLSKYGIVKVKSKNLETGEIEYKKILSFAKTSDNAEIYEIKYKTKTIKCTGDHLIYTKNRGYIKAKDLTTTDILDEETHIKLGSLIIKTKLAEKEEVYDIAVEDNNNFYANEILVHNCTEIALPSFPDEDFYFKVKDKKNFDNFIEQLYINGEWYQLYRYIMYKIEDEHNKKIVEKFKEHLDSEGEEAIVNFGEIFSCILGGINFGKLSKNVEKRRKQFNLWLKLLIRFLDEKIDYQEYKKVKPFEKFSKNRRALGISPGNLFYMLAKYGYDYNTQEARDLVNEVMEEFLYYALKNSMELAKEKGKCKYFNDTKYSLGLTPVDWYNKNVDLLVSDKKLKLNWNKLKENIKKYGLRNSTLLTAVPSSNSSRPANMISGINPPKGLLYGSEDQKVKVLGLLPDIKKYEEFYKRNLAWNIDVLEYWKLIAIIQKYTDQAISLNEYIDYTKYPDKKMPILELKKREIFMQKYGIKTLYYVISKTEEHDKNVLLNEDSSNDVIETEDNNIGCSGGGCTL